MKNTIIVDLEATCTNDASNPIVNEIIEIGAVNLETGEKWSMFVRPILSKRLTMFCKNLTSITQADVDSAETFDVVFAKFLAWAGEDFDMMSWGNYDHSQFKKDCALHGLRWPPVRFKNVKVSYATMFNDRPCGLKKAVSASGLHFEGTAHRGVDDAYNIYRIIKKYPQLAERM